MPQLPRQWGEFVVHGVEMSKNIPSSESANERRWLLRSRLDTIKTGDHTIPSIEVQYLADAKAATFKTVRSQPIPIRITSVLESRADPTKFRDIKDTVDLPVPEVHSYAWIGWTAAGTGSFMAFGLLTVLFARRNRGPSPATWALAQIANLEQLRAGNAADAESIYNELVNVVSEFFELEFHVPTLSRTSREFLTQAAHEVGLAEKPRKRLALLASMADKIKFARLSVGDEQIRQALEHAKAFVQECEQHRAAAEGKAA